jgi:hypothetical protein
MASIVHEMLIAKSAEVIAHLGMDNQGSGHGSESKSSPELLTVLDVLPFQYSALPLVK